RTRPATGTGPGRWGRSRAAPARGPSARRRRRRRTAESTAACCARSAPAGTRPRAPGAVPPTSSGTPLVERVAVQNPAAHPAVLRLRTRIGPLHIGAAQGAVAAGAQVAVQLPRQQAQIAPAL